MDVCFLCLEPTYPCRLFPLPFFHSMEIRNRPFALSRAERADEVSIDLILWKHTDKGPLKPVLVQSPFFPNKVSMKREAEKHNYSSYWLISFFPRAKGLSPLWDKTQNVKRGGGGWTQWAAKIPGKTESVEDWGWLKNKNKSGNRRGRTTGVMLNPPRVWASVVLMWLADWKLWWQTPSKV